MARQTWPYKAEHAVDLGEGAVEHAVDDGITF
jgi:hypothetical protein